MRRDLQIETVLPGENGASPTYHVYRVFSTTVAAGPLRLGSAPPGSLPYFILLRGGNHVDRHPVRKHRHSGARRPLRSVSDDHAQRRWRSILRKNPTRLRSGGNTNTRSSASRRAASTHRLALRKEDSVERSEAGMRRGSSSGDGGGSDNVTAVSVDANPSWNLSPLYSLGVAGRSMTSISKTADIEAGKAASAALKIAAISSVGPGAAGGAIGGGVAAGGADVTKQPRLRFKVTLLCEHGIFLQMDDIHRLENTAADQTVEPTFELAFKLPGKCDGEKAGLRSGSDATARGTVVVEDVGCPREGCGGELVGAGGQVCDRCGLPAPVLIEAGDDEGGGGGGGGGGFGVSVRLPSVESGLTAMLDFEHVASAAMLGEEDSLSMTAAFGVEGRYFNPRVHHSEHFIEPWR